MYHPLSHSPSGSWAETVEEQALAEDAPLAWTSSEESEDDTAFEGESLTDEDPRDIAVKAWEKLGLLLHQTQQDKPDIWASPAFNRPLIGTENDRGTALPFQGTSISSNPQLKARLLCLYDRGGQTNGSFL